MTSHDTPFQIWWAIPFCLETMSHSQWKDPSFAPDYLSCMKRTHFYLVHNMRKRCTCKIFMHNDRAQGRQSTERRGQRTPCPQRSGSGCAKVPFSCCLLILFFDIFFLHSFFPQAQSPFILRISWLAMKCNNWWERVQTHSHGVTNSNPWKQDSSFLPPLVIFCNSLLLLYVCR